MMAKQFEAMSDLEFKTDDRYAQCVGGYLVEGGASLNGRTIALTPETLNGIPIEKAKPLRLVQDQALEPSVLTITGGTTLSLPPGQYGERLTFVRHQVAPGRGRVSGEEQPWVGHWTFAGSKGMAASSQVGGDYVVRKTALNLQADGQFQMRFSFHFEGKWRKTAAGIELDYGGRKPFLFAPVGPNALTFASPDGRQTIELKRN